MRMNKKVLTLAGVALTAMSLAACGNNDKNKASGDLNVTLKANPVTLDPAKTIENPSESMQIQSFEGLLSMTKTIRWFLVKLLVNQKLRMMVRHGPSL